MRYNKLVRDRIPEIIIKKGGKPKIHVAGKEEYWQKLKDKLHEEVKEFIRDGSKEEIADILEIIEAICSYKRYNKSQIKSLKAKRLRERGGFKKKIILDES